MQKYRVFLRRLVGLGIHPLTGLPHNTIEQFSRTTYATSQSSAIAQVRARQGHTAFGNSRVMQAIPCA